MDSKRTITHYWAFRREIGNALGYEPSPHYAWAYLDGDQWREYPAWDVDLNVAMELTHGKAFDLIRNELNGRYRAGLDGLHAWADTPAEAICKAAIMWWNAKRQPPATQHDGSR